MFEQHRADHPALRSSLLGRGEPALLDHAAVSQPGDQSPGGERAELASSRSWSMRSNAAVRSASSTHCRLAGSALQRAVDGLDRVVTAAAGPEPVRPRLEPRLPLGLQRVARPGPAGTRSAITGIPSGRCFPFAFGMYTRLTGSGLPGRARAVDPVRQRGPGPGRSTRPPRRRPPSCGQR